jgi:hypothetical protein
VNVGVRVGDGVIDEVAVKVTIAQRGAESDTPAGSVVWRYSS